MKSKQYIALLALILAFFQFVHADSKYGICVNNVIPVRKNISAKSEQVTQLMFGDCYKVLKYSLNKQWLYIKNAFDGYEGWIKTAYHYNVSEWYYKKMQEKKFPVSANNQGIIIWKNKKITVTLGTTLPFYTDGKIRIGTEEAIFKGEIIDLPVKIDRNKLITNAYKFLKTPYLWGGKGRKGVDCSGFTQIIYKSAGYELPRDSYQQAEKGKLIALENAKPGDLAFFHRKGRVIHVGIVLANGKIIHANQTVQIDKLDKKGIFNLKKKAYSHYLKFIRRYE